MSEDLGAIIGGDGAVVPGDVLGFGLGIGHELDSLNVIWIWIEDMRRSDGLDNPSVQTALGSILRLFLGMNRDSSRERVDSIADRSTFGQETVLSSGRRPWA